MLVCWEWLAQYVDLESVDPAYLADRFAMTGLNHESTQIVGSDTVIDLEVTSNRGDCLGHIGVAREAAVILGTSLKIPSPRLASLDTPAGAPATSLLQVVNEFPEGCSRYTARILRGVRVGPSPDWLVRRLAAVGVASINNVVDATNYVMLECGQPLHAFDLKQIRGGKICVRRATAGETLVAIDHRTYQLDPHMIVIADAQRAVAIGGVMGGAESEVTHATSDLLIEVAAFEPLAIRRAARLLKLQSASSFRFERRPDPAGLDWASRRCCELIMQLAGGELCAGMLDTSTEPSPLEKIVFRLAQIPRVLGIEIPSAHVEQILAALGCTIVSNRANVCEVIPPSWRGDLTREVDLIEEVARIFGYEQIPENVSVPLSVAAIRPKDNVLARVRQVLSACGIDEAMTASVVPDNFEKLGSPWTSLPALATETPLLVGSRLLRRSLLPSLLAARYGNQTQAIRNAQLYEVANLYFPAAVDGAMPLQICALGMVTHGNLQFVKGIVEEILSQVASQSAKVSWHFVEHPLFATGTLQQVRLQDQILGYVGLISPATQAAMSLEQSVAAAEIDVDALTASLQEVRTAGRVSLFPAMIRDLNFIVDEGTQWASVSQACTQSAGPLLQKVDYRETYRDAQKDGAGKKRLLLSLHFQSLDRTLTSDEVDVDVARIIAACGQQFDARLNVG